MNTQEVEITRSRKGWSIHTIQHWQGWPNPTYTNKGESTLAWAVYTQYHWASQNDTQIIKITVDGLPLSRDKAEAAIRKVTAGGLHYTFKDTLAALYR